MRFRCESADQSSVIVFIPIASRQDTPIAASARMERVMEQLFT